MTTDDLPGMWERADFEGGMTESLWPCGCLSNKSGAHRRSCPRFETMEEPGYRWWRERREPQ